MTLKGRYNEAGNPKRKAFYAKTKAEADRRAREFLQQFERGSSILGGSATTVTQWFDYWLRTFIEPPNREPKTYRSYEGYVRLYVNPMLGRVRLRDLSTAQVKELMNSAAKGGLGPYSLRNLRATLRAGLQQAFIEEHVLQNAAARIKAPKIERSEPVHLEAEQVVRFLDSVKVHPLGPLFAFALHTGARVGEATGLRFEDVDFAAEKVSIRVQLQRINGKLVHKSLKSLSARRTNHLVPEAVEALQAAKVSQMINGYDNPLGLVFLNPEGRPLDPKYVDKKLKTALTAAGLPPLGFHKLRHTAATLMLAEGGDLHAVKNVLGHSQISLTTDLYGHPDHEANQKAVERLANAFRRKRG